MSGCEYLALLTRNQKHQNNNQQLPKGKERLFARVRYRIDFELTDVFIAHHYQCTVDDINCKIRLIYTPIRADGVKGKPQTAETETITLGLDLLMNTIELIHFLHSTKSPNSFECTFALRRSSIFGTNVSSNKIPDSF